MGFLSGAARGSPLLLLGCFALADKGHGLRLIRDGLGQRDRGHTVHYTRTAGRQFDELRRP